MACDGERDGRAGGVVAWGDGRDGRGVRISGSSMTRRGRKAIPSRRDALRVETVCRAEEQTTSQGMCDSDALVARRPGRRHGYHEATPTASRMRLNVRRASTEGRKETQELRVGEEVRRRTMGTTACIEDKNWRRSPLGAVVPRSGRGAKERCCILPAPSQVAPARLLSRRAMLPGPSRVVVSRACSTTSRRHALVLVAGCLRRVVRARARHEYLLFFFSFFWREGGNA